MPIYHYECECGVEYDRLESVDAPRVTVCSHCGHRTARRTPAVATFVLRGDKWARDGYSGKRAGAGEPR